MWCDDFDGDLFKLVPDARAVLAPVRDVTLYTTNTDGGTGGKVNLPTCWNTMRGSTCYFGRERGVAPQPDGYWTDAPVIACTLEELARDLWVHEVHAALRVDRGHYEGLWNPGRFARYFWALLYAARGQRMSPSDPVADGEKARIRVVANLRRFVERAGALRLRA